MDVTEKVQANFETAKDSAQKIKADASSQLGVSFSIGVGPNKLIAKIACDSQKPDGLTIIKPQETQAFLSPQPVDHLLGVGKKITARMDALGIKIIGDLAKVDVQKLIEVFGKILGVYFHNAANGVDNEPVVEQGEAESISRIGTLKEDTRNLEFILQKTDQLIEEVGKEVGLKDLCFKRVSIVAITTNLTTKSRSVTLGQPAKDVDMIKRVLEASLKSTLVNLRLMCEE